MQSALDRVRLEPEPERDALPRRSSGSGRATRSIARSSPVAPRASRTRASSLPPAQRQRAKLLSDRITDLGRQYDARLRDENTKVAFAVEELAGVPEPVWKDKPRDDAGRVLLGVDSPTLRPVVERADKASTRERIWRAKLNEGGDANLALLAEIARLRREYAQLFGMKTFADFQLRRG